MTISVLVADDQALLRGSLCLLVNSAPDMTAIGEAGDGAAAVTVAQQAKPDVILMDIRMPGMDGIEATRVITAQHPDTRVLVLTTFDLDEYVFAALRAGASGFLLKDTPPGDLLAAIRVVATGDALLAPGLTRKLIAEFARQPAPALAATGVDLSAVTEREREVLTLIGLGLSNDDIAARLYVSMSTTKTHVGRLLLKLGARDRAQLVIAAYEAGLVGRGHQLPRCGTFPARGHQARSASDCSTEASMLSTSAMTYPGRSRTVVKRASPASIRSVPRSPCMSLSMIRSRNASTSSSE
jgi:DNA-binding NarL/FixJ family response regulator